MLLLCVAMESPLWFSAEHTAAALAIKWDCRNNADNWGYCTAGCCQDSWQRSDERRSPGYNLQRRARCTREICWLLQKGWRPRSCVCHNTGWTRYIQTQLTCVIHTYIALLSMSMPGHSIQTWSIHTWQHYSHLPKLLINYLICCGWFFNTGCCICLTKLEYKTNTEVGISVERLQETTRDYKPFMREVRWPDALPKAAARLLKPQTNTLLHRTSSCTTWPYLQRLYVTLCKK